MIATLIDLEPLIVEGERALWDSREQFCYLPTLETGVRKYSLSVSRVYKHFTVFTSNYDQFNEGLEHKSVINLVNSENLLNFTV